MRKWIYLIFVAIYFYLFINAFLFGTILGMVVYAFFAFLFFYLASREHKKNP